MPVPTLRFRVSAKCYETYENTSAYLSFNSLHVPTMLPTELSPSCENQMIENLGIPRH